MKSFEYATPRSLEEAIALLGDSWGTTEILAGGTDLVTSLKQNITQPRRVVSLKNIPSLKGIKSGRNNLRIGATTTLAEMVENSAVKKQFPALVSAAQDIGSAQILNVGTVGGDLCQRPRCWYFRNGHGLFGTEGNVSLPRTGQNRYHAIFGNDGPALFVSASSLGPVFIALNATVVIATQGGKTREVPAAGFFRTPNTDKERETVLRPNEIVTEIQVPTRDMRNANYEVRHRNGLDWPYVTAAVAFEYKNGVASGARVVLGHVAPTPWSAGDAAQALEGARIDASVAAKSAEAAVRGAKPLSDNAYKIQLVKTAVKRAVLAAAKV